jgi:flavin-binding protein dodecin
MIEAFAGVKRGVGPIRAWKARFAGARRTSEVAGFAGAVRQKLEDAAQQAVGEASNTLHNIRSVYVKEFEAAEGNGEFNERGSQVPDILVYPILEFQARPYREAEEVWSFPRGWRSRRRCSNW